MSNKQKTAMQELISSLDIEIKAKGLIVNWEMYLEKERQQIVDAFDCAPVVAEKW